MTTKEESRRPYWYNVLVPVLLTVLVAISSWTLKEIISLKVAVAVSQSEAAQIHETIGDINNVESAHSRTLEDHGSRITRLEALITMEHK